MYADVPDVVKCDRSILLSDLQVRYICKQIGITPFEFSEVRSQWLFPPQIGDFAVTHPHKTKPRVYSKQQIREVKIQRFKLKIKRWLHR